jgi:hypothetical protein
MKALILLLDKRLRNPGMEPSTRQKSESLRKQIAEMMAEERSKA